MGRNKKVENPAHISAVVEDYVKKFFDGNPQVTIRKALTFYVDSHLPSNTSARTFRMKYLRSELDKVEREQAERITDLKEQITILEHAEQNENEALSKLFPEYLKTIGQVNKVWETDQDICGWFLEKGINITYSQIFQYNKELEGNE